MVGKGVKKTQKSECRCKSSTLKSTRGSDLLLTGREKRLNLQHFTLNTAVQRPKTNNHFLCRLTGYKAQTGKSFFPRFLKRGEGRYFLIVAEKS